MVAVPSSELHVTTIDTAIGTAVDLDGDVVGTDPAQAETSMPGVVESHFQLLVDLTDERGLFEHVKGKTREDRLGYCTDDNALLLVVTSREPHDPLAKHLSHLALNFVLDALDDQGRFHNRMDRSGKWADRPRTNDWWGRSIWGLGTAVSSHDDASVREMALKGFESAIQQRSQSARTSAFAAFGAAEVLSAIPNHAGAKALLSDASSVIPHARSGAWEWPEPRLTYANAVLPHALIVSGNSLEQPRLVDRGLELLAWLLDRQTRNGHLSFVGLKGEGPTDAGPSPDQQPVEASSLADACWSAYSLTNEKKWVDGIRSCAAWFNGDNDAETFMFEAGSNANATRTPVGNDTPRTAGSVIWNHGAESMLAYISTMQRFA